MCLVRRTIAVIGSCAIGLLANAAAPGAAKLADFQGHTVHKVVVLGRCQPSRHALAEVLKLGHQLAPAPVEDGAVNLADQRCRQLLEKVAFRVNARTFGSQGQGDQLLVAELGQTALVQKVGLRFQFAQKTENFVITYL